VDPHTVIAGGHATAHVLLTQVEPGEHALPHDPQWSASRVRSTHWSEHELWPFGHVQLALLEAAGAEIVHAACNIAPNEPPASPASTARRDPVWASERVSPSNHCSDQANRFGN